MVFEIFSPEDVRGRYARATDKPYMLRALAELTCSTEDEMAEFLGIELPSSGKINAKIAFRMYREGKRDYEIAQALGVSRQAVHDWRKTKNLPTNGKVEESDRMDAYNRGLSDRDAAKALGMSRETFRAWRKKNGLKPNN